MINTVLGQISPRDLGKTLMHEHIMIDYRDADWQTDSLYSRQEVVQTMIPFLEKLKKAGCATFVDATPPGCGRDVLVLKECALRTGINFIASTGAFRGKRIFSAIRQMGITDIGKTWIKEFTDGIDDTGIKPGLIKIAFADGSISEMQKKILRAAMLTSMQTGLAIQAHIILPETMREVLRILEVEDFPLGSFIWAHADCQEDLSAMLEIGKQGIWIQLDSIGYKPYKTHLEMLNELITAGLLERLLISQDRGWYIVGSDKGKFINPYHLLFTEFLPFCRTSGLSEAIIKQLLIFNPACVLDSQLYHLCKSSRISAGEQEF